jgi:hypothetical protein
LAGAFGKPLSTTTHLFVGILISTPARRTKPRLQLNHFITMITTDRVLPTNGAVFAIRTNRLAKNAVKKLW